MTLSARVYTPIVTSNPMLRTLAVLLLLATIPAIASRTNAGRKPKQRDEEDRSKPRLHLLAEPTYGFTPVTVVLTGRLSGVDPQDRNFCHPAVTWIRQSPGQLEKDASVIREDPACLHGEEEVSVPTVFSKTFDLYRPGTYLFRLLVKGRDGKQVSSAYTQVQVLRVQ